MSMVVIVCCHFVLSWRHLAHVSGHRSYYLRGAGARLQTALQNFALDTLQRRVGIKILTPKSSAKWKRDPRLSFQVVSCRASYLWLYLTCWKELFLWVVQCPVLHRCSKDSLTLAWIINDHYIIWHKPHIITSHRFSFFSLVHLQEGCGMQPHVHCSQVYSLDPTRFPDLHLAGTGEVGVAGETPITKSVSAHLLYLLHSQFRTL